MSEGQGFLSGDFNNYSNSLNVHSAPNVEDLLDFIKRLPGPIHIQNIYAAGARHYVWFTSNANIQIVKKKRKKSKTNEV